MTTLLATVPASKPGAAPYSINLGADNNVYCSCPAWKFQKLPPKERTCKHINALSGQLKILASKLGAKTPASVVVAVPKAAPAAPVAAPAPVVAAPVAVAAKVAAPVASVESKKAALAAKKAALAAEEAALAAEEAASEKAAAKAVLVAEVASLKKALALAEAKLSVA